MTTPSEKTVVFDLGQVLVRWDPEGFYDRQIGEARRKALFQAVDMHGHNLRIDLGETKEEVMQDVARQHPEFAEDIMLWSSHWLEMLYDDIPHSVRLLKALKAKGHPVVALTNFGWDTLAIAEQRYPFLTLFDRRFVSGELRTVKPRPDIYEAVEDGLGVAPEQLVFADDSPANVEAAQARGWHAHLFTEPQGWADFLVAHGILTREEAQ